MPSLQKRDVPSDPYAELTFRSEKYAGAATEIHLGGRGITRLANFETFLSLDTLWINNNKLTSLRGLENNFRLQHLFAHQNNIRRIQGTLQPFKFLSELSLDGNLLDSTEDVLDELSNLKYLRNLNLFGNSIAQEDGYRLRLLAELPWIDVLDRIKVTDEEREAAREFKLKMDQLQNYKFKTKKPPKSDEQIAHEARQKSLVDSALMKMRSLVKTRRIQLETYYLPSDLRSIGIVDEDTFLRGLREYFLLDLIADNEKDALLRKYSRKVLVDAISNTSTMQRKGISYKQFCSDLLPAELRVLEDDWKATTNPELSKTGKDLERYATRVRREKKQHEETLKRQALLAASSSGSLTTEVFKSLAKKSKLEQHGLTPWLGSELLKIFKKEIGSSTQVRLEQIESVFRSMRGFGVMPTAGISAACESLLGKESSSISADTFKSSIGLDTKNAVEVVEPIIWRALAVNEVLDLRTKTFQNANNEFQQLIRSGNPEDTKMLFTKTFSNAITATRLASKDVRIVPPVGILPPDKVVKSAAIRSDYFVLPRMHVEKISGFDDGEEKWISELRALGVEGEALTLAIARKDRSLQLQKKLELTLKSTMKGEDDTGNKLKKNKEKSTRTMSVLEIMQNPPPPPKGWNKTVGTIVMPSTG